MPSHYYKRIFVPNYCYHVYNRGANKRIVFKDHQDHETFIQILSYYLRFPTGNALSIIERQKNHNLANNPFSNKVPNLVNSLVNSSISLTSYVLMPNHFHFLFKQVSAPEKNNNITNLMRRLTITYAMYFKKKYDHSGVLFQGKFKNVLVDSDKQLLTLTKYLHTNPLELLGSAKLKDYPHSSYQYYIGANRKIPDWLNPKPVLELFGKNYKVSYQLYVEEQPAIFDSIEKIILDS